jgi:hypothetical protein
MEQRDINYDIEWREEASCIGMDTNDFFPERINKFNSPKLKTLAEMCEECKVRIDCFMEAAKYDYDGMWGGIHDKQRRKWMKHMGFIDVTREECEEFFAANTNLKVRSAGEK